MKGFLLRLLTALATTVVFYLLSVGVVTGICYGSGVFPRSFMFNRSWLIYAQYLLPLLFLSFNLMVCFISGRRWKQGLTAVIWICLMAIYWLPYVGTWPRRSLLIILTLTGIYGLNLCCAGKLYGTEKKGAQPPDNH